MNAKEFVVRVAYIVALLEALSLLDTVGGGTWSLAAKTLVVIAAAIPIAVLEDILDRGDSHR